MRHFLRIYGKKQTSRWYLFFCLVSVGFSDASYTTEELAVDAYEGQVENAEEIIKSVTCTKNEI